jgi:hypothetical protein
VDIIPVRKSNLLYQRGDLRTKGVVDLRNFSVSRKNADAPTKNNKKSVSGIIRTESAKIGTERVFQKRKDWVEQAAFKNDGPQDIRPEKGSAQKKIETKNTRNEMKESSAADRPEKKLLLSRPSFSFAKNFVFFLSSALVVTSMVFGLASLEKELERKDQVLAEGTKALGYLKDAGISISNSDLVNTQNNLSNANLYFSNTKNTIDDLGMGISGILNSLPINTPLSTAKNIASAGENVSLAGKEAAGLFEDISFLDKNNFSIDQIYPLQGHIRKISTHLETASDNMQNIDDAFVPEDYREKLATLKDKVPYVANNMKNLDQDIPILLKMLGSENRLQKYLFIFENNTEIRAGGGFIGSYAIADIENGKLENFFVDGIFNPDGQLKEKIVPPMPIQKISAAWSMHDANWFADFPLSAKKVASFYEKTGGPTVDGVIAITPNVIENILGITGPIAMPEYNTIVDKDNFLRMTQLQVEELYDKKENNPKKFLADLAPRIIEKLLDTENLSTQEKISKYLRTFEAFEKSLKEKHIVLFHREAEIENMILKRGWGGQIQNSSGDYLSVVNSNINGFKTDAVVDETIDLRTEIMADGSIIDTVKITRIHNGGDSDYDWYNRVNADYMRVYVPLGSTLLEAKGHTIEEYAPPMDYSGFKTDEDVEKIEKTIRIDVDSKTQIFEESGKTVFGNWVFVSPKEKVEVTYKYKLPYKINFDDYTKPAEKYSILVQKQLGSRGSKFNSLITIPINWKIAWTSNNMQIAAVNEMKASTDLASDKIFGTVFTRNFDNE